MFILNLFKEMKSNHLVRGSFYLFIGSVIVNLGNYAFNIMAARMLTPSDYGSYMALLSILMLLAVPSGSVQTVFTRFVAKFTGENQLGKINELYRWGTTIILMFSTVLFVIFYLFSPIIAQFINVEKVLVMIMGFSCLVIFLPFLNRGVLGGSSRFGMLSISNVADVVIRILLGYLLLKYGFGLKGLMLLISLQGLVVYLLTLPYVCKIVKAKMDERVNVIDKSEIYKYIPLALGAALLINLLLNTDLLLVKHYFDAETAGQYAGLATIGKIVFYISGAIGMVLLPVVAEKQAKDEQYESFLFQAVALTAVLAGFTVLVFYTFPGEVIKILFGSKYLQYANYLGLYSLGMFCYSISNILVSFYLSINYKSFIWLLGMGGLVQIILIMMYHNNIGQVVFMNFSAMLVLSLSLMFFQIKIRNKEL